MLSIFSRFLLRLLSLRYSIEITGSSTLRPRGVLVLPNHVALVDPLIVSSILYNHGTPVAPLVSETYFNLPLFRTIFRRVGAVDMPDFDRGSRDTTASSTAIQILRDRLAEGNNFLVYPAGRIYRQGRESIVGKKTAYELVRTLSGDTRIILMRTR